MSNFVRRESILEVVLANFLTVLARENLFLWDILKTGFRVLMLDLDFDEGSNPFS